MAISDRKYRIFGLTAVISACCVLISVGITYAVFRLFGIEELSLVHTMYLAAFIPSLIAPVVVFVPLRLIEQLKATESMLEEASQKDYLTGVNNRRRLLELLEREFSASQRYRFPLSLVLMDIDHFKNINDEYGHQTGDYVLKRYCQLVSSAIRTNDIFGRYGGEEFMLVCPHTDLQGAMHLLNRLKSDIGSYEFSSNGHPLTVTSSFGVAARSDSFKNLASFINASDRALYQAKNAGRNCIKLYQH
jgi:polar amino acid transport system substrate-binding protein